jgi:hypothetical protein
MDRDDGPVGRLLGGASDEDGDDDEWRFSLDEVGPDADEADGDDPGPIELEPEPVTAEHAVFVAVGVALTLFVVLNAL